MPSCARTSSFPPGTLILAVGLIWYPRQTLRPAQSHRAGRQVRRDPVDAFGFEAGDLMTAADGLPGPVLPSRIRAPTWRIAATMSWAAPPSRGIGGHQAAVR